MIQRIQTVFLLLATILMAVVVFGSLPLASLANASGVLSMSSCGIYSLNGDNLLATWGVFVFGCLAALIPFITIFLYKRRKVQIKMCYCSILLIVAYYITSVVYLYSALSTLGASFVNVAYGSVVPVVSLVLLFLAVNRIKADEKLVRSLDRIR